MNALTAEDWLALLPVLLLSGAACAALVADLLFGEEDDEKVGLAFVALAGTLGNNPG